MELSNWAPEHSDALREFIAKGMTFSEAARAINSRFNTSYSRSAALGRARRLGLGPDDRQQPSMPTKPADLHEIAEPLPSDFRKLALPWPTPVFSWSAGIAATPMAAMKRARPSLSAVIRAARVRAIARPIFI